MGFETYPRHNLYWCCCGYWTYLTFAVWEGATGYVRTLSPSTPSALAHTSPAGEPTRVLPAATKVAYAAGTGGRAAKAVNHSVVRKWGYQFLKKQHFENQGSMKHGGDCPVAASDQVVCGQVVITRTCQPPGHPSRRCWSPGFHRVLSLTDMP